MEIQTITIIVDGETSPAVLKKELRTVETPNRASIFFYEHVWERLGSPRSLYDPSSFERDLAHLREYFLQRGYFHAAIDTAFTYASPLKMAIEIRIKENVRSRIDTVKISGLESVTPEIAEEIKTGCTIRQGMPYSTEALEQERVRALNVFHNGGYPDADIDAIVPVRYFSTNNITVSLHYTPGRRFVFGPVTIVSDTVAVERSVALRQLDFSPGEVYNEEKKTTSEQNLNRLGLLENASLKALPRDEASQPPSIPMQMSYRVIELKEITPEFELSDENKQFNTGVGLAYSHRNFLSNASTFTIATRVRVQDPQNLDWAGALVNGLKEPTLLTKADIAPQIFFPYFYGNQTSATATLSLEAEKQSAYTLNAIRGRFGVTHKFAQFTTGFAEWELERVDMKILGSNPDVLKQHSLDTNALNSIVTLTLQRDKTDNLFSPTSGFFHSVSIEESGTLPRLLKTKIGGQPYSNYVKASFLVRQYYSINATNNNILAMKLKGGAAYLYDKENSPIDVPLTHRFFAGGAGSVRGWNFQSLTTLNYSPAYGGDVLLEGSVEDRIQLFHNWGKFYFVDLEQMWGVLFVDAGNLWNTPAAITLRDVALAAGFGFRYETFIGPIRFDVGLRVYDPKAPTGEEWIFSKQLLYNSHSVFHFGLGHAF